MARRMFSWHRPLTLPSPPRGRGGSGSYFLDDPWRGTQRFCRQRAAMTLTELLIVIAIMTLLLAIALPLMKTGAEERKLREVSRMINGFIASVRAKAASTGRPAGIIIRRNRALHNGSIQLLYAETPQLFGGAWEESRVVVVNQDVGGNQVPFLKFVAPDQNGDLADDRDSAAMLTRMLDDEYKSAAFAIKFNYQGRFHEAAMDIASFNPATPWTADFALFNEGQPFRVADTPLRYQVQLRPRPAVGEPLELPDGVSLDLGYSGYDEQGTEFNVNPSLIGSGPYFVDATVTADASDPTKPPPSLTIMFHPGGSVDRVYGAVNQDGVALQPLQFIHLLVGKTDQLILEDVNDLRGSNLADTNSLWITIVTATGNVVTSENAGIVVDGSAPDFRNPAHRIHSRQIARSATAMGGR